MMRTRGTNGGEGGFTLIEVLVAFSILLVGMTGIIAMFGTGLKMERRGRNAFDAALVLDELRPRVRRELDRKVSQGAQGDIRLESREVPGYPGLSYSVRAMPAPGETAGRAWLVDIRVAPTGTAEEDAFSFGWLPYRLAPTFEELVRRSMEDGR
ncbi:MAG: prepilin-type N-terminal cleavage/methylation domain-containing protein [Planctomycetota bacterium]